MRTVAADLSMEQGIFSQYGTRCVGAGRAGELLRTEADRQLEKVAVECGFQYLRFHGIFHDEINIYAEDKEGKPVYNWQYADLVYDAIVDKGMKPFVELSFMPSALASGQQTLFFWNANVTPPKDYNKWFDLIYRFASHLVERYGLEEVLTWPFEVWNEPDHPSFFTGTKEDYYLLYETAAKAIKSVDERLQVGGPATAGPSWIPGFIAYCKENQIPLDFVATHRYCCRGAFDEFGDKVIFLERNHTGFTSGIVRTVVQVHSMRSDLPVHFTEWSATYSARDPIHDSYVSAPFILSTLKNVDGAADSLSYWTYTDIFDEVGPPNAPFHGGFGLLTTHGIPKSAYYAFQYYHKLQGIQLQCEDPCSLICKNGDEIIALLWDLTLPDQGKEHNRLFYSKDLQPKTVGNVELYLNNVAPGTYVLVVYQTGYGVNDAYTDYQRLGAPNTLSRAQEAELKRKHNGSPIREERITVASDGIVSYQLPMRENDVYLCVLRRMKG